MQIGGDVRHALALAGELQRIARTEQCCDFHCVTTWTHRSLQWSERGQWFPGWLLRYLYRPLIGPTAARFDEALQRHQARVPPPEPSQTTSSS